MSGAQDRVPPWVAYSGVTIVGGTALVVLAYYQHLLGLRAGMPEAMSWTFSIGLDWGSAVAGVFWFFTDDRPLRRWAAAISVVLIAVSTTMTCISWGLTAGRQWAALGIIHPLVFFSMAKLLTMWQAVRARIRDEQAEALELARAERERQAERAQEAERKAARKAERATKPPSMSAQMRDWIREELDAGREVTAARADRHFGLVNGARVGQRELAKVLREREMR